MLRSHLVLMLPVGKWNVGRADHLTGIMEWLRMVTMIISQDHTTGGTWRLHMHVTMAILTVGMLLRMRWGHYTHTYPVAVDHMLLTLYNHLLTVDIQWLQLIAMVIYLMMTSLQYVGHFVPFPGYGYGNYGYPMYLGPRGYPGPVSYPSVYPPYGYPLPPLMMNRQRPPQHRGRGSDGKQRRPNQPLHSVIPHQTAGGN